MSGGGVVVAVIGAGAAGIAAATRLLENKIENLIIFEAENRIGGRIHSEFFGENYIDLGAEEVHGENGNVVVELAKEFLQKKTPLWNSICFYSNGEKIEEKLRNDVLNFLENFNEFPRKIHESIGKIFNEEYRVEILEKYKNDQENSKKIIEFLELCESFFLIFDGPFSWFQVVVESGSHYVDCDGDQFLGWKGCGCRKILEILTEKTPEIHRKISLNTGVKKIIWNNRNDIVKIQCENNEIFISNFVIFTPSVGVLRENHEELFEPNLPENKTEILKKIGYSNVMKIALKFEKNWWKNRDMKLPFGFVWKKEDKHEISKTNFHWITSMKWLIETPENDRVLIVWLTGEITIEIEKLSDEILKNGVTFALRKFLGNYYEITDPENIIATRWYSNRNFRGTYSYETVEASKMEKPYQEILAESLENQLGNPKIFFAGEATHSTQYSTVNGAILSGYREADRIIEFIQESK